MAPFKARFKNDYPIFKIENFIAYCKWDFPLLCVRVCQISNNREETGKNSPVSFSNEAGEPSPCFPLL